MRVPPASHPRWRNSSTVRLKLTLALPRSDVTRGRQRRATVTVNRAMKAGEPQSGSALRSDLHGPAGDGVQQALARSGLGEGALVGGVAQEL
jgi:hypothetical protein